MKIEGIDIPDEWCVLLKDLQTISKSAIIAGGAIRDQYFGRTHKDIDFFTTVVPQWGLYEEGKFDYEGMKHVLAVGSMKKNDLDINIILVEEVNPLKLVESFDLGFCQIGFDGNTLIKTPAFEWDNKYGVITMRHIDRYSRSVKRYCRINERYHLDLIIPELEQLNAKPNQPPV